jgi:uncharacterized protein DUF4342
MTKEEFNQQSRNIVERGKEAIAEGKQRNLVFRKQDGSKIFETNLTIAAAVSIVLLFSGFVTFPIVLIAAIAAYASKVKVELIHKETTLTEQ